VERRELLLCNFVLGGPPGATLECCDGRLKCAAMGAGAAAGILPPHSFYGTGAVVRTMRSLPDWPDVSLPAASGSLLAVSKRREAAARQGQVRSSLL
jgi:hypothetical protein